MSATPVCVLHDEDAVEGCRHCSREVTHRAYKIAAKALVAAGLDGENACEVLDSLAVEPGQRSVDLARDEQCDLLREAAERARRDTLRCVGADCVREVRWICTCAWCLKGWIDWRGFASCTNCKTECDLAHRASVNGLPGKPAEWRSA